MLLLALGVCLLSSCSTSTEQAAQNAIDEAKGNLSFGFNTGRVENGYELSGHAGTRIMGVKPYASFKVGVKYEPQPPVELAPVVVK